MSDTTRSRPTEGCPESADLVAYAEGLLPAGARRAVGLHLGAGCERCRGVIGEAGLFTDFLLTRLAGDAKRPEEVRPGLIERIEAAIGAIVTVALEPMPTLTGSGALRAAGELRAGTPGRAMVYGGGGWYVQVRMEGPSRDGGAVIRGRIVAEEGTAPPEDVRVVLLDGAVVVDSTEADRFGRFRFERPASVDPCACILKIWASGQTELVVTLPEGPPGKGEGES